MTDLTQELLNDINWHMQLLCRSCRTFCKRFSLTNDVELRCWLNDFYRGPITDVYRRMEKLLSSFHLDESRCDCMANSSTSTKTPIWLPKEFGLIAECASCDRRYIWSRFTNYAILLPPPRTEKINNPNGKFIITATADLEPDGYVHNAHMLDYGGCQADYLPIPWDIWSAFMQGRAFDFWREYVEQFKVRE